MNDSITKFHIEKDLVYFISDCGKEFTIHKRTIQQLYNMLELEGFPKPCVPCQSPNNWKPKKPENPENPENSNG